MACGASFVEEKEKRQQGKYIPDFTFNIFNLPDEKTTSKLQVTLGHSAHLSAADGQLGEARSLTHTQTHIHTDILWHMAPAKSPKHCTSKQNTVQQLNYNGDLCLPREDVDNISLSQTLCLPASILVFLPLFSLPLLCTHTLSLSIL